MNVVVLGAGLLGVTSAYFLRQQGHDVTVIDRQATPAAETSFGTVFCAAPNGAAAGRATLMIRPEHITFADTVDKRRNLFEGEVRGAVFLGRVVEYDVALRGASIRVQALSGEPHEPGARVCVHLPPERCIALAETADAPGA